MRRLEQQGLLGAHTLRGNTGLVPVEVAPAPASAAPGTLRIEFGGGVQLHVTGDVDTTLIERVIGILRR